MFVTVYLIGGTKLTLTGKLFQTAILLLFFVPFSYVMDSLSTARTRSGRGSRPSRSRSPSSLAGRG